MARRVPAQSSRISCPRCRRLLPAGCDECVACELDRLSVHTDGCHCRVPVPTRRYLDRWLCAVCVRWMG